MDFYFFDFAILVGLGIFCWLGSKLVKIYESETVEELESLRRELAEYRNRKNA